MITQVRMLLHAQNGQRIDCDYAYGLYGALMRRIPENYADFLHQESARPLNHYLLVDRREPCRAEWVCNILDDEAAGIFLPRFADLGTCDLPRFNCTLQADPPEVTRIDPKDFAHAFFASSQAEKRITLHLCAPVTFHTEGRYALYPTAELILKSAAERFSGLHTGFDVDDPEAIAQLISATEITGYSLHSFRYRLKNVHIPAFMGRVSLTLCGPEPMVRLFDLLLASLAYTGLGIKTSLGMGGVEAEAAARTASGHISAPGFAPRTRTGFTA